MENALIVMACLLGGMGVLWVAGQADQFVQKLRGVEADQFGRRPDGMVAIIALSVFIIGGFVWYVSSGGAVVDTEWPYRR